MTSDWRFLSRSARDECSYFAVRTWDLLGLRIDAYHGVAWLDKSILPGDIEYRVSPCGEHYEFRHVASGEVVAVDLEYDYDSTTITGAWRSLPLLSDAKRKEAQGA